jgi:hypothetical protein
MRISGFDVLNKGSDKVWIVVSENFGRSGVKARLYCFEAIFFLCFYVVKTKEGSHHIQRIIEIGKQLLIKFIIVY